MINSFEKYLERELMKDRIVEYDDLLKVKNMSTGRKFYMRAEESKLVDLKIGDVYQHNNKEFKIVNIKKKNRYSGLGSILPTSTIRGGYSGAGYVEGDKEEWTLKSDLE